MMLRDLLKRVNKFDPDKALPVKDDVEETDIVVGDLPEELIKPYGVISEDAVSLEKLSEDIQAKAAELGRNITDAQREAFEKEYQLSSARFEVLQKLLWVEIKSVFPQLVGHAFVGLRKGLKVVIIKDDKCDCPICRGEAGISIPSLALVSLMLAGIGSRPGRR